MIWKDISGITTWLLKNFAKKKTHKSGFAKKEIIKEIRCLFLLSIIEPDSVS